MVRLLAPAEAEQSKQKDALRRQQWMRIPLVPTLATCSPLHAGHMPGGPSGARRAGQGQAGGSRQPSPASQLGQQSLRAQQYCFLAALFSSSVAESVQNIPGSLWLCTHLQSSAKLHVWLSI